MAIYLIALVWVVSTALVFGVAMALARRFDPHAGAFLPAHAIVIAWSWIVALASILSVASILSGPNLMVSVVGLALAFGGPLLCSPGRQPTTSPENSLQDAVAPRYLSLLWILVGGFLAAHVFTQGLLKYPTDYDSLMYHLPLVDDWIRAGSLYIPDNAHWPKPGANELITFWAVAVFPGDFLATLGNLPATLLLVLSSLELARLFGLSPMARHLVALAAVVNFVTVNQLVDVENDVAAASLFLASLCYGLRASREERSLDIILYGASLGLLIGVKYYALGYALAAGFSLFLLTMRERGNKTALRITGMAGMMALVVGGYWYIRNAAVSGSPLFPLMLGHESGSPLKVDYPSPWQSTFLGNSSPEVGPMTIRALWKMTGPWHALAVILAPATLGYLVINGITLSRRFSSCREGRERLMLAFVTAACAAVLAVTPMTLEDSPGTLNQLRWSYTPARYGLCFLSMASLTLGLVYHEIRSRTSLAVSRSVDVFAAVCILIQGTLVFQRREFDLAADAALALLLAVGLYVWNTIDARSLRLAAGFAGVATLAAASGIAQLAEAWERDFTKFYDMKYSTRVFRKLADLGPSGVRLGLLDFRCYPFFSARRETQVCQPRPVPSFRWLRAYVESRRLNYVITRPRGTYQPAGWDSYGTAVGWLEDHPESFRPIYADPGFVLYQFGQ